MVMQQQPRLAAVLNVRQPQPGNYIIMITSLLKFTNVKFSLF